MTRRAGEAGQATVELLGMVPLCVVVVLAIAQVLAAGAAREAAGAAATAGAMAQLQGGDAQDAARAAAPGWAKDRLSVDVDGRVVRVRVTPRAILPGTAPLLVAHARADAGPRASRPASSLFARADAGPRA
jgi:hypothetical protein